MCIRHGCGAEGVVDDSGSLNTLSQSVSVLLTLQLLVCGFQSCVRVDMRYTYTR